MTLPIEMPEFKLLNMSTGETVDIDQIVSSDKPERWDKVYTKNLARMLDIVGDERMKVISFLLRKKDTFNLISATMREIAESTNVSPTTVNKVLKAMQKGDYIHKVRGGKWRLSPRLICGGKHAVAMATINYYDNIDGK